MRGAKLWAVIGGCLAVAGIALYFTFFSSSDEERIRRVLDQLAATIAVKEGENILARTGRIRSQTKDLVEEDVRVNVEERALEVRGRKQLEDEAAKLGLLYQKADCTFASVKLKVDPHPTEGSVATVDAVAILTATRGGDARADRRAVHFLLRKDGGWKITSIDVAAPSE